METLKIDIQNDAEKRVLLAFLDSLNYQYRTENDDYTLNDEEIQHLLQRKTDFVSGKTTSKPWNEL